jgi:hypothetical protein
MSGKTIDIVVIQTPEKCVSATDKDNCEGYLSALSTYYQYNSATTVKDIPDFINRIIAKVGSSGGRIKNLVIGSHGAGGHYAYFRIGNDIIDNGSPDKINSLRILAPFFAKDADVFILACHTGENRTLLEKVSTALGGVKVHGYTGRIETDGITVDDGTSGGGKQTVCLRGNCTDTHQPLPDREDSPVLKDIHLRTHGRF